ncbi:MAG: hypothetical protein ACREP7_19050 [Lysobacter sp.]
MRRLNRKFYATLAALTLGLGAATGAFAWPPPGQPYVEMVYYYRDGHTVGMRFVSHDCEYPQPPGWGEVTAESHSGTRMDCYGPAPIGNASDGAR